jgi:protein arginine N-methyltransferase 1
MDRVQWGSSEVEFQSEQLFNRLPVSPHYQYEDNYYFESYSHHEVHEDMLKDKARTLTYKKAILRNSHLFAGKRVLDVGCGTGVLSIFAAKAGAAVVIGIDCADIVRQARENVRRAGLEGTVTLIQGRVEEVSLPVEQVDIIISEWMGIFLLYEGMLDTVIFARDKWLAPGGLIFPDKAKLFIAGIEDAKGKGEKIEFWTDVYNIDMRIMREQALQEPSVDVVSTSQVATTFCPVLDLNLYTVTPSDLEFISSYTFKINRTDFIHGLVAWFEVGFSACHKPLVLSTSPKYKPTHWKQMVFYLDSALPVTIGEFVTGSLAVRKNLKNPRELDIKLSVHSEGRYPLHTHQYFKLK